MPTTANMSLVLPTEGGDIDIWDTLLNAVFVLVDEHDHTTGKGVKVPSAALKINADVSWSFSGTNYAITDLKAVDFAPVTAASVASLAGAFFVSSADSELYFRTVGGTNIKFTSGTTLNVSIVGGIGGDYSSVSALLDYDDATDTYRFRQESSGGVRQYAKVSMADLIIREYDAAGDVTVPVETITIKSPDALAASYAITLPTAVPGSTLAVQMSSAGALSLSNAFTGAVSSTSTMTGTSLRSTSDEPLFIPCSAYRDNSTPVHTYDPANPGRWRLTASTGAIVIPVELQLNDRITDFTVQAIKNSDATNTLTARLERANDTTGAVTTVATATNSANAPGVIGLSPAGFTEDVVGGYSYHILVWQSDSTPSAADDILFTFVNKSRP